MNEDKTRAERREYIQRKRRGHKVHQSFRRVLRELAEKLKPKSGSEST